MACKVCKEGLVEDEYHLLFTCSTYSAIHESYDDIISGGDDLSVTLKRTPRRLGIIQTSKLSAPNYEHPFLRREHISRQLLCSGPMGQY